MPMSSSAFTPRGVSPSPQTFSRGNAAFSRTTTSRPACASHQAALEPAGPAPTTTTSARRSLPAPPRPAHGSGPHSPRGPCESVHKVAVSESRPGCEPGNSDPLPRAPSRRGAARRARAARTSSSEVAAEVGVGLADRAEGARRAQADHSSTSGARAAQAVGEPMGTATVMLARSLLPDGDDGRAHRRPGGQPVVDEDDRPAAQRPPAGGRRGRRSRGGAVRPSSRRRTSSKVSGVDVGGDAARTSTRTVSTVPPTAAMAPMASSGCQGRPSLRTTRTSSGAPSAAATSAATTTPPRGSPSTTASGGSSAASRSPSARPAARRSANRVGDTTGARLRRYSGSGVGPAAARSGRSGSGGSG